MKQKTGALDLVVYGDRIYSEIWQYTKGLGLNPNIRGIEDVRELFEGMLENKCSFCGHCYNGLNICFCSIQKLSSNSKNKHINKEKR